MERMEKPRLSADSEYGYCFKQGLFARFYEQSLYWFSTAIKPLKPMLEPVKGGEPILYGGLPIAGFEKLLAEGVWPNGKAGTGGTVQRGQGRFFRTAKPESLDEMKNPAPPHARLYLFSGANSKANLRGATGSRQGGRCPGHGALRLQKHPISRNI